MKASQTNQQNISNAQGKRKDHKFFIRPKAALFCAHWEIQNLVFMFFFPVLPLAFVLLQVKSFGHSQRAKCKRNESMCQFVYAKALNLPFPLCIWNVLLVCLWRLHWTFHIILSHHSEQNTTVLRESFHLYMLSRISKENMFVLNKN